MRYFLFGDNNTWSDWKLTLTAKDTPLPEPKTNYVNLDGVSGSLDLTEALAGEVTYNDRTVTASFWTSEGTFEERVALVNQIGAALHGKKVEIVEPDDQTHYFLGRVKITAQKYSQVHSEFTVEAICDPWRYALEETVQTVEVDGAGSVTLANAGVKSLCPDISVTGSVTLTCGDTTVTLEAGTHKVPGIKLRTGETVVNVAGSGTVTFRYREAGL